MNRVGVLRRVPARLRGVRSGDRRPNGYSLLEILIVLMIVALIATLVGPRLFAQLDRSKSTTARVQGKALRAALDTMQLDIGRYPTQDEGLTLLFKGDGVTGWYGPYLSDALPKDPWGRDYVYRAPAEGGAEPAIISYGSDGKPGGSGPAADVLTGPADVAANETDGEAPAQP